jgi:FeS assembly protein IscX
MLNELTWNDPDDIGYALAEKFPQQNPMELRFTDLHKKVVELVGFTDDPRSSNESKLEAIQMAWYEEWQERQG